MHRRKNQGADEPNLGHLMKFEQKLVSLPSVPIQKAAKILRVDRRTIYRRIEKKKLEVVPRGGVYWVTVRSIRALVEAEYKPSLHFNILRELEAENLRQQ